MANLLFAAMVLSGILAVAGCAGPYMDNGLYGYGGGAGAQLYPYDALMGAGCGGAMQPYYQPQPYAYYDNTVVYANPPAPGACAAPPGQWIDRRQQYPEERLRRGAAAGELTHRGARHVQREQGRMRADGHLDPRERGRLNAMQTRSSRDMYRQRHNEARPGAAASSRHPGPARPLAQAQARPAGPPHAAAQPRGDNQRQSKGQSRSNGGRGGHHDGG
jgi:hypothetical protein